MLVGAVTVGYVAAPVPFLSSPMLADAAAEAVDARTVKYFLKAALRMGEEEEEEEEERKEWEMEMARRDEQQRRVTESLEKARSALEPGRGSKRKRKKRRKRRLPRSSVPHGGLARRRHREWHTCGAGSPRYVPLRAVFPSVSGRLVMLGIMAGMDQKGFFKFVVFSCSCRSVQIFMVQTMQQTTEFPQLLYVSGGRCPCCADRACHAALVSTPAVCAHGWLCWLRCASAVFLLVVAGQDLRHHGRYGPKEQLQWHGQGWYCW